ncbi:hypothetical protein [Huintestinicola sp.]
MNNKLSEKETALIKKLKSLPYDLEDKENGIIMIMLFASERNCIDDIIKIANEAKDFDTVITEVFKNESVEIVDEEE